MGVSGDRPESAGDGLGEPVDTTDPSAGAPPFIANVAASHVRGAIGLAAIATVWLVAAAGTGEARGVTVVAFLAALGIGAAALALFLAQGVRAGRTLLFWPVAGNLLLLLVSWLDPHAAALVLGTLTIGYVAVGVTQPQWTSLLLLPLSVVVVWFVLDLPADQAAVRIFISACVWVTVAELPAWLIRELREARAAMSHMAVTDALTGLANRRAWEAMLDEVTARATNAGESVIVMMADLDRFKQYNDAHGHLAGDELLIRFAERLRALVRSGDVVARWGGEEFAIVLRGCEVTQAREVAERIRAGIPGQATCSVGVTAYIPREPTATTVDRADAALYDAKRTGRDRVCFA